VAGLFEPAFSTPAEEMQKSVDAILSGSNTAGLKKEWRDHLLHPATLQDLRLIHRVDPAAIKRATEILASRPHDVRYILMHPGYPLPEVFGGYFDTGESEWPTLGVVK
jgi:hypothetical protein